MAQGETWTFTVPGRPVPKVRMTQSSKWSKPAMRTLAYQRSVAEHGKVAIKDPIEGPVELTVRFVFATPRHPDLKNLIAAIEDGLQYGGVVANDNQIIRYGPGTGIYHGSPERVEIALRRTSYRGARARPSAGEEAGGKPVHQQPT